MGIVSEIRAALRVEGSSGEGTIRGEVSLPGDFSGFRGHFPDHPIVPAVCQIEMARCLVERSVGKKLALLRIRSAKYIRPICVHERVSLEVEHSEFGGALRVKAVLSVAGERRSSVDLDLVADA